MTAKRFIIMDNLPKGTHTSIWDSEKQHNQGIGDELWLGEVVAMLNEGVAITKENEQLKSSDTITDLETQIMKLKKENKQLKRQLMIAQDKNRGLMK